MVGRQKPKRLRSMGPIWSKAKDYHFDSNHVICIYMAMAYDIAICVYISIHI